MPKERPKPTERPYAWRLGRCKACGDSILWVGEIHQKGHIPVAGAKGTRGPIEVVNDPALPWRCQPYVREVSKGGVEIGRPLVEVLKPGDIGELDEPVWWCHWGSCDGARGRGGTLEGAAWRATHPSRP